MGGLVGSNSANIADSYATGSVTGGGDSVGGLVGFSSANTANISGSYATGAVFGVGGSWADWSGITMATMVAFGRPTLLAP